jgi:Tol biopolymer transport system component
VRRRIGFAEMTDHGWLTPDRSVQFTDWSTGDRVIGTTIHGKDYFSASFSPDGSQLVFDRGTDSAFGIFVTLEAAERAAARLRDARPGWFVTAAMTRAS